MDQIAVACLSPEEALTALEDVSKPLEKSFHPHLDYRLEKCLPALPTVQPREAVSRPQPEDDRSTECCSCVVA